MDLKDYEKYLMKYPRKEFKPLKIRLFKSKKDMNYYLILDITDAYSFSKRLSDAEFYQLYETLDILDERLAIRNQSDNIQKGEGKNE